MVLNVRKDKQYRYSCDICYFNRLNQHLLTNKRFQNKQFVNKYCQYFDCPNFTNIDRNYITKTLLLPHINSRFLLHNSQNLYIMYARINDPAIQPQEFHISTFFTDKEISDYQQQADSS